MRRKRQLNLHCIHVTKAHTYCSFDFQVGGTALHYAASRGHVDVARELLNQKAYVNGRTNVCIIKLLAWTAFITVPSNRSHCHSHLYLPSKCTITVNLVAYVAQV